MESVHYYRVVGVVGIEQLCKAWYAVALSDMETACAPEIYLDFDENPFHRVGDLVGYCRASMINIW